MEFNKGNLLRTRSGQEETRFEEKFESIGEGFNFPYQIHSQISSPFSVYLRLQEYE